MNIIDDSYESISSSLTLDTCLPYDSDWSAAPDFLKLIIDSCLNTQPQTIVECSSGVTTLVLARCCQINGTGHVYSLENGSEYAIAIAKQLKIYGLDKYADVIHSPLHKIEVNKQLFDWYQVDKINVSEINMMIVDGPSGFIQKNSRYPALPVLYERLSSSCEIFLDDASRPDEKEIVKFWLDEYSDMEHQYIENDRGCSILKMMS